MDYGEQFIAVVDRDPNRYVLPVSLIVVESKTKD